MNQAFIKTFSITGGVIIGLLIVIISFNDTNAQGSTNLSSNLVTTDTNISNFVDNNTSMRVNGENITEVKNITEISNATSGQTIPLQQIVIVKNNTSNSTFDTIVNGVESKGATVIYIYKELLNGFAFRAVDEQMLNDIVSDLQSNPSIESVTPDKTAGIMSR